MNFSSPQRKTCFSIPSSPTNYTTFVSLSPPDKGFRIEFPTPPASISSFSTNEKKREDHSIKLTGNKKILPLVKSDGILKNSEKDATIEKLQLKNRILQLDVQNRDTKIKELEKIIVKMKQSDKVKKFQISQVLDKCHELKETVSLYEDMNKFENEIEDFSCSDSDDDFILKNSKRPRIDKN
jgi:hypothetical protein